MGILLIGLVVALTVSRSLRHSRERTIRLNGYYVSKSYRARMARAHGVR